MYDPEFVADLFDRCSANYRRWSAVSSFGFIYVWRYQCVARIEPLGKESPVVVDLMAGTGEIWPHILRRFPEVGSITALDISHRMHLEAVERLHQSYADKIVHLEVNALETDLPTEHADIVVSSFGLKTFDQDQQAVLAEQIARILKPGGRFSLIEASDPKGWMFRPLYRFYLDRMLPQIERFFLKGANDFSMIGTYTRNFGNSRHMAQVLRNAGLVVEMRSHFFGCATSVAGHKPGD
ncbi:ubiquinone biosynthesis methyltransferase UbiE [Ruegeria sp. ANG-S4]|nr:ubiquinone biosynthesis methyltransferase UbiE [Ruegeria sp. ANG-S4]